MTRPIPSDDLRILTAVVALAVYAFLGAGVGYTAQANVPDDLAADNLDAR